MRLPPLVLPQARLAQPLKYRSEAQTAMSVGTGQGLYFWECGAMLPIRQLGVFGGEVVRFLKKFLVTFHANPLATIGVTNRMLRVV